MESRVVPGISETTARSSFNRRLRSVLLPAFGRPRMAKRTGLLHDIGKALDHDMEGTHVQLGVDVLKKYKENPLVINAVEAHHGDVEPQTMEAVLVQAADAISASRE